MKKEKSASTQGWWLVKQEPTAYPFSQLVKDKRTAWTGVRNFQARNNLRAMKEGDRVFYYHSVEERQVVGLAKVVREAYPDPTAPAEEKETWVCVDLAPVEAVPTPVTLAQIKADPKLKEIALVRQSRLSVVPLTTAEAARLAQRTGVA